MALPKTGRILRQETKHQMKLKLIHMASSNLLGPPYAGQY